MTDDEKFELLTKFIAVLSESTYKANAVAQTAVQLLIKKNIVAYDEAAEMRNVVEQNTATLKALSVAITLFDKKVEEIEESRREDIMFKEMICKAMNKEISDDEFRNFLANSFNK